MYKFINPSFYQKANLMKKNEMFMTYSTVCVLNPVQLFATLWTIARQAPLSLGFSRQEYWNGLPFPLPGGLPDAGIELTSCTAGRFSTTKPGNLCMYVCVCVCVCVYTHFPHSTSSVKEEIHFYFQRDFLKAVFCDCQ